jgi:DNA-binding GntR family transcriptional regulator
MYEARSREVTAVSDDQAVPRVPERPYEIVAADLRRRIAAGEWQRNEMLPTVNQLAEVYDVSRATITRTLHLLASEGLVRIVPRWGTFRA